MKRLNYMNVSLLMLICSCKEKEQTNNIVMAQNPKTIFREITAKVGNIDEVKCPSYDPKVEGLKTMCFAGRGDTTDLINKLASTIAPYLKSTAYFSRDYAIWDSSVYFEGHCW